MKKISSNNQHVLPRDNGWAVKKAGSSRDTKVFDTQKEAKIFATEIAKNKKSEVFIHAETGRIRERNSFGQDPHHSKG
ncbi:MAG: DUF2188 domain-containing protein [Novosphingobium sp.]|nr:DUF2188 domain-containing protein [Novosphingobium sp.]